MQQIVKYIILTQTTKLKLNRSLNEFQGMVFKLDKFKGLEVYVNALFAGDWNKLYSEEVLLVFYRIRY